MFSVIGRDDGKKSLSLSCRINGDRAVVILERLPIAESEVAIDSISISECNDKYSYGRMDACTKATVICPADDIHVKKYSSHPKQFIVESEEEYARVVQPWIHGMQRAEWVENIVQGKAERERVLWSDDEMVILPDSKSNHDGDYLLVVFRDDRLKSLRDLADADVLLRAKENLQKIVHLPDYILYFHYPPSYYRLHLHAVRLDSIDSVRCKVGEAVLLESVLSNLSTDKSYYSRAALPVLIPSTYPLYKSNSINK